MLSILPPFFVFLISSSLPPPSPSFYLLFCFSPPLLSSLPLPHALCLLSSLLPALLQFSSKYTSHGDRCTWVCVREEEVG